MSGRVQLTMATFSTSNSRPGSVWETRELDSLKNNPAVTRIVRVDPKAEETEVLWER